MSVASAGFKTEFLTAVTDFSATDLEGIGIKRFEGTRCYKWVQNKHSADLTAGSIVFHSFADAVSSPHTKVSAGATANLGFMAGVAMSAIPVDNYGWIQILGRSSTALVLPNTSVTMVAGASMFGVNAQLYLANTVTAMGTAPLYPTYCKLLAAVATVQTPAATAATVDVHCFI